MYQILGMLNIILLIAVTSPYWLRKLNKKKSPAVNRMIKNMRKVHKQLGVCLALIVPIHGYPALGALRLHTGSVVFIFVVITVILGLSFYQTKKPVFFKWHKRAALMVVLLTLLHLIAPNALSGLL